MKILALATMIAFTATAGVGETPKAEKPDQGFCQMIGGLANAVMAARQRNVPLSQMMTAFGPDSEYPPELQAVIREMALNAYQRDQYSTPEIQNTVIARFRNDYETACYLAGGDK